MEADLAEPGVPACRRGRHLLGRAARHGVQQRRDPCGRRDRRLRDPAATQYLSAHDRAARCDRTIVADGHESRRQSVGERAGPAGVRNAAWDAGLTTDRPRVSRPWSSDNAPVPRRRSVRGRPSRTPALMARLTSPASEYLMAEIAQCILVIPLGAPGPSSLRLDATGSSWVWSASEHPWTRDGCHFPYRRDEAVRLAAVGTSVRDGREHRAGQGGAGAIFLSRRPPQMTAPTRHHDRGGARHWRADVVARSRASKRIS